MTQSIMLHHILRAPSDLYLNNTTREQLQKLMHSQSIVTSLDADQWFDRQWDRLFETVESFDVDCSLFEPLYIERDLVKKAETLDWETDTAILKSLTAYQQIPLGITYAKIKIDFYNLKRLLMFKREMNVVATGFIDRVSLETYASDVKGLVRNSIYHEPLEGLDIKNVELLEKRIIRDAMEAHRMDGTSDNGLFSKLYFNMNELIELRGRMKAELFNIELSEVVLAYE